MFRMLTLLIAALSIVLSIFIHPMAGWIPLCLLDLSVILEGRFLRKQYRWLFVRDLSVQANILMSYYSHYFARPDVSKDFRASARILQVTGVCLSLIGLMTRHLWAIVFGAANWLFMAEAALIFSPLPRLKSNAGLQEAFDEVKKYLRTSTAGERPAKDIEITSGSHFKNNRIGAV